MSDLVPEAIDCPDCGGTCRRMSHASEEGFAVGDVVAYRCQECGDRWDFEIADPDDVEPGGR